MNVKIENGALMGEIIAPPSKSFAHRYLISAFLSGEECLIKNAGKSKDVLATLSALKALGAEYSFNENDVTIKRIDNGRSLREVNCDESGSTMRFLIPVAAALGIDSEFTGSKRLLERPIGKLAECLNSRGAKVVGHKVTGKLSSGVYRIDASVSSQYISGLMLALPLLNGDSVIVLEGGLVSKGYLDITIEVLKDFGIEIEANKDGYFIKGNQKYRAKTSVVEGDYSGASFILCSGAINGEVTVKGLNQFTSQGDGRILQVLKQFGAKVTVSEDQVTVKSQNLKGIEVDVEDIPDLAQIISVVGAYASGKTVIKNVERLKIKESDRLQAIIDMLTVCGIKTEVKDNSLIIYGGKPTGGEFFGGNDHRTVMSSAVLALHANGSSTIIGAEAVSKSYPDFFEQVGKIGGRVNVNI